MNQQLQHGEKLLRENPALRQPDWLPEGIWPELDELHDRHVKLLADLSVHLQRVGALRRKYDDEDEAREKALSEGDEPPKVTTEAKRDVALSEAKASSAAAKRALAIFLAEAVALVQEKEADWLDECAGRDQAAEAKRIEAQRLLDEAKRDAWIAKRARMWVERTAKDRPMLHIAGPSLSEPLTPPQEPVLDLEQMAGRT